LDNNPKFDSKYPYMGKTSQWPICVEKLGGRAKPSLLEFFPCPSHGRLTMPPRHERPRTPPTSLLWSLPTRSCHTGGHLLELHQNQCRWWCPQLCCAPLALAGGALMVFGQMATRQEKFQTFLY
jgi:hypothetical protein